MTTTISSPDLIASDAGAQPDIEQLLAIPKTSTASASSDGMKSGSLFEDSDEDQIGTPASKASEKMGKVTGDARSKISSLLKEKEREWSAVADRKRPLQLLDLPMDVLKEIVKEVTHTNDLTALALTHSALHNLAIPHIYSRFDIVWPDAHATTDPRTGVDALTYGLATLCMGDVFTDHSQTQSITCSNCGSENIAECSHGLQFRTGSGQQRLGNQYPQFTRKFSLGNGPADWVQEYLITKESGKMLGTLVALAVARMVNLETFVWDMPTGVLRDVWLALSSLQNRNQAHECRLERVWVRWHDNSEATNIPPGQTASANSSNTPQMLAGSSTMTSIGWKIPSSLLQASQSHSQPISYANSRVEYPTLSVLPPLKSLSVLDIDELDYLDEMSVVIAKSKDRLRELRVGISSKAVNRDFAIAWDGADLQQVDHKARWPGASTIGEKRLGGVLGVLLGRVFDIRKKIHVKPVEKNSNAMTSTTPISSDIQPLQTFPNTIQNSEVLLHHIPETLETGPIEEDWAGKEGTTLSEAVLSPPGIGFSHESASPLNTSNNPDLQPTAHLTPNGTESAQSNIDSLTTLISAHQITTDAEAANTTISHVENVLETPLRRSQNQTTKHAHFSEPWTNERDRLEGKLRLQTLELERVPLSVAVLQKAFDWSVLTNLTILDCEQHDRLWTMLRKQFQPSSLGPTHSSAKNTAGVALQYHLNLRKVHTDAASSALISFLKETLAPNTLETLFLQDRKRSRPSNVTIDAIYRGPLKRHRASLKRVMLDSSDKIPRGPVSSSDTARWRAWMPSRDVLNFITSGRMSSLRELSIALDYKDWHHFLQRLPQIPHLRSLNIPFIADHATPAFDPRELALQVVDVIVLRPEVELCYMGISHKCFEILENRPHDDVHGAADHHSSTAMAGPGGAITDEEDEDEEDDGSDDEEEEEEDDNGTAIGAPIGLDPDETESEISDHDDSDTDSWDGSEDGGSKIRLRLREILFYDDKVAIFKARHGRL